MKAQALRRLGLEPQEDLTFAHASPLYVFHRPNIVPILGRLSGIPSPGPGDSMTANVRLCLLLDAHVTRKLHVVSYFLKADSGSCGRR